MFSRAGAVIVLALFLSILSRPLWPKSIPVTEPNAQVPNEPYYEGLRNADRQIFDAIYTAFRKPVIRAVEASGGSSADGSTFFRVALIQISSLARDGQLNEAIPMVEYLKALAVEHFRDWAKGKNMALPEYSQTPEAETTYSIDLPGPDARHEFRQYIRAKRQFSRLDGGCQNIIRELAKDASLGISDPRLTGTTSDTCLEKYRQNLGEQEQAWSAQMPAWVVTALTDEHFQHSWSAAEALESRLNMGQSSAAATESKSTRNVLLVMGFLLLAFGLWRYFGPPTTAKTVYDENFHPPTSIMADRAARSAHDSVPAERIEKCEYLFEQADVLYQQKDYGEAANVLYTMIGDDMEGCNSDALFYLGIIGLQVDAPEITVECLAKIPDLDKFGEDLYWYQALAFVKIAAQNPLKRNIARRAVERARSNTEIPERRLQAEKMLEQLTE